MRSCFAWRRLLVVDVGWCKVDRPLLELIRGEARIRCIVPIFSLRWKLFLFVIACLTLACPAAFCQATQSTAKTPTLDFHAPADDPYANTIDNDAGVSIQQIQTFFGAPYPDPIHFEMVADRAAFDEAVAKWGLSPTQCWMVGMGTADLMVLLSPEAWPKQACEHDPKDVEATRLLVKHELVHVYHGQYNPTRDFTGIDDLDWFIEGLAVYVSGQLTPERLKQMDAAVSAGQAPASLSKVWTGPNRYAFAGSLVRCVDRKWGRAMLFRLLKVRSQAEALQLLGTDEKALLAGWRSSLKE